VALTPRHFVGVRGAEFQPGVTPRCSVALTPRQFVGVRLVNLAAQEGRSPSVLRCHYDNARGSALLGFWRASCTQHKRTAHEPATQHTKHLAYKFVLWRRWHRRRGGGHALGVSVPHTPLHQRRTSWRVWQAGWGTAPAGSRLYPSAVLYATRANPTYAALSGTSSSSAACSPFSSTRTGR
jgi:hypothetical protein